MASARKLAAPYLIEHRCLFRQPKQIERNREFCEDRVQIVNATKQEDDPKMLQRELATAA